ncbi:MAG: GDP-4-dehydro-6-deoxy-D-mannose reductase [Acidimicrobiales bacterium]|jgi:GDP-4-dehydro-6-deoxy-D-mannose reductase
MVGKALVTGAAGFVGPHLLQHLAEMGDDASGTDLADGPDLLDSEGWRQLVADRSPDVIYHLAGWSDVGRSWNSPAMAWRVNTEGVISVLEAARANEVGRVIVVSSADIYGIVAPDQLPITEDSPCQPRSPYGASKEGAEALARQYHRGRGLDVVIARPFNHIGPGQGLSFAAPAFAHQIAQCEQKSGGVVTHGDLSPRRDLTDVRDVVRAYRLLATAGRAGQTYNICSGADTAMSSLLNQLIALADVPIDTMTDAKLLRPVELPVLRGSHDRITSDTGWKPERPLNETLRDVLDDARQRLLSPPSQPAP